MSEAGKQIIEGAMEAVAVASGAKPAARMHVGGFSYVPEPQWQPIETAPKDRPILVFGTPTDIAGLTFNAPGVHTAYWDAIDSSFCIKGATWLGPFIKPLCWQEEPPHPSKEMTNEHG